MEVMEQVKLNWSSYQTNFFNQLSLIRQSEVLTDVRITCGNETFRVHRLVLSASSEYFRNILENDADRLSVIHLVNSTPFCLTKLLEFIYTGSVRIPSAEVQNLLNLAQDLQVSGLYDADNKNSESCGRKRKYPQSLAADAGQINTDRSSFTQEEEDSVIKFDPDLTTYDGMGYEDIAEGVDDGALEGEDGVEEEEQGRIPNRSYRDATSFCENNLTEPDVQMSRPRKGELKTIMSEIRAHPLVASIETMKYDEALIMVQPILDIVQNYGVGEKYDRMKQGLHEATGDTATVLSPFHLLDHKCRKIWKLNNNFYFAHFLHNHYNLGRCRDTPKLEQDLLPGGSAPVGGGGQDSHQAGSPSAGKQPFFPPNVTIGASGILRATLLSQKSRLGGGAEGGAS